LAEIPPETDVVYVDESGVTQEMNPIRGRSKRGVKLYQETTGKRIKKDNVIAGYLSLSFAQSRRYSCSLRFRMLY
jgi:hypothetical protein